MYNFTTYELYIFFIFDLFYIFCLYFLYSVNYEGSLFSFDQKLARKLLNQIFTQSKQPIIHHSIATCVLIRYFFSTSNRVVSSAINDKFDEWQLRGVIFSESFGRGKFSFLSYHESNLSLITQETIRLLVNHQLILIALQPKSISLEQTCYKRSQDIVVTSLNCLLFSTSKYKDLKRISKSATNVEHVYMRPEVNSNRFEI